jgi:membrane-associated phospholipid phosphatase
MKKQQTVEIIILASVIAALAIFFLLGIAGGFAGNGLAAWVNYYAHDMAGSLAAFFYYAILLVCLLAIVLVIWTLGGGFLAIAFPKKFGDARIGAGEKNHGKSPRETFLAVADRSREVLLVIPAILFITIVALAMGEANEFAPARLKDAVVIGWEHALFGNYVFAALGNLHYPSWLLSFIIFSFDNMALGLIIIGIILAYIARARFRELLVAFCIGILVMVPLWLTVPVLSPQDRFINNMYKLPDSPPVAAAVANYHPQPQLAAFLQSVRTDKAGLPVLPTSTFPSAHVFWATLAGYYLFRAGRQWRWLAWIVLPFLVASTFGTILLAQHYFIDVPAGLAVAALAIWLAHGIEAKLEMKLEPVSTV